MPLPFTTRMQWCALRRQFFPPFADQVDETLARELHGLGTVRHLVSPDQFHYAHIAEWARAFPETISWASPHVRQRARARHIDINFTRDLEADAPEEWRGKIDQLLFPGGYFKEFIFFHKASRTSSSLIRSSTSNWTRFLSLGEPLPSYRDVSSLRPNILRHATAATVPARKGEVGDRKDPLMAAASNFAQSWALV